MVGSFCEIFLGGSDHQAGRDPGHRAQEQANPVDVSVSWGTPEEWLIFTFTKGL